MRQAYVWKKKSFDLNFAIQDGRLAAMFDIEMKLISQIWIASLQGSFTPNINSIPPAVLEKKMKMCKTNMAAMAAILDFGSAPISQIWIFEWSRSLLWRFHENRTSHSGEEDFQRSPNSRKRAPPGGHPQKSISPKFTNLKHLVMINLQTKNELDRPSGFREEVNKRPFGL